MATQTVAPAVQSEKVQVYGYRWVVLSVYMFAALVMQIYWICFAPVASTAAQFLGVSELDIGFLAMSFMYIYIPLSIPASWAIDTYGYKKAVGFGVVLMGVAGLLRGIFIANWSAVLIFTLGIAIAQPLVVNSLAKVVAKWFPLKERATVMGLGALAGFFGIMLGQVLTPILVGALGFPSTYLAYGIVGALATVLFVFLTRENPPTPAGFEERVLVLDGLKLVLRKRDFWLIAAVTFVTFAIWNGISTWVEGIVKTKGLAPAEIGTVGGLLFLGGIVGVFVIPQLSDRLRKRKPIIIVALLLCVPWMLALTYLSGTLAVMVAMFLLGFFMIGVVPVSSQYTVEICYPSPEGTTGGLWMLVSQLSVIGITGMGWAYDRTGSFSSSLLVFTILLVVVTLLLFKASESKLMQQAAQE